MDKCLKKDEQAILLLRKLYQNYGYQPYKMSRFEEYDLYVRNKATLLSTEQITRTTNIQILHRDIKS